MWRQGSRMVRRAAALPGGEPGRGPGQRAVVGPPRGSLASDGPSTRGRPCARLPLPDPRIARHGGGRRPRCGTRPGGGIAPHLGRPSRLDGVLVPETLDGRRRFALRATLSHWLAFQGPLWIGAGLSCRCRWVRVGPQSRLGRHLATRRLGPAGRRRPRSDR